MRFHGNISRLEAIASGLETKSLVQALLQGGFPATLRAAGDLP